MHRRWRAVLLAAGALLIVVGIAGALFASHQHAAPPSRAEADKPTLLLLTSLPLVFPEEFGLKGGGSRALTALRERYRVRPIAVADAASLRQGRLLFMAHALAQPAEALVDLDAWVRGGGHVLLLADPRLEWESSRPLGDALRPSPMFPDTGLLAHWGLRLVAPETPGPAERHIGKRSVMTLSPGALSGKCAVSKDRLVARCGIGKGEALIVADADFLNVEQLDGKGDENLDALLEALASVEPK
ncbi:MAG: hypothetical protein ABIQ32_02965 [Sphingomicrobium sp.]